MQLVDVCFGDSSGSMVDDVVYTAEVVDRLDNVVDTGVLSGAAEGVGLEDIPGVLFRQPTAFSAYWLTAIYSILSARSLTFTVLVIDLSSGKSLI